MSTMDEQTRMVQMASAHSHLQSLAIQIKKSTKSTPCETGSSTCNPAPA